MRTLNFEVIGQKLTKVGDFSNIIKGSKQYLRCEFSFSGTEWMKHKIVAIFEQDGNEYPVAVLNSSCMVPDEVSNGAFFKMRLLGVKDNYRINTNKVLIEQR